MSNGSDDDFSDFDDGLSGSDFGSEGEDMMSGEDEMNDNEDIVSLIPPDYLEEINTMYREALKSLIFISARPDIKPFDDIETSVDEDGFGKITLKKANLLKFPLGFFKKNAFKSIRTLIRK